MKALNHTGFSITITNEENAKMQEKFKHKVKRVVFNKRSCHSKGKFNIGLHQFKKRLSHDSCHTT